MKALEALAVRHALLECHYIDLGTQKVAAAVGADQQVQKTKGKWMITNLAASTVTPPAVGCVD